MAFNTLLKRALGLVYVVENEKNIEIRGVKAQQLGRDIMKLWGSSRVEKYMFDQIDGKFISFPKFFAPDVHYILRQVHAYKGSQTSKGTIKTALAELEEKTWLKNITADMPDILDRSKTNLFKKTPMPHQVAFLEAFNHRLPRYGLLGYLLAAGAGTGKMAPLNSRIKIPGGWTTMGEIKPGDTVTAWDGTPSKVTGVYPHGDQAVYRITFADGRSTQAGAEHLWRVCNNRQRPHLQWSIVNTIDVMRLLEDTDGRVHIQLIESEQGPDLDLPIDPYLLGVILGDGGISQSAVNVTKGNQQLFDNIRPLLPQGNRLVQKDEKTWNVVGSGKMGGNPLMNELKKLDLMGKLSCQKWIPSIYLHGSHQQRLSLLQGLLDTDGTVNHPDNGGQISFCSSSLRLALNVQYLVRSLGGIARISNKQTWYTYGDEKLKGRPSYVVNIRYKKQSELFRLDAKKDRTNDKNQYADGLKLRVESVVLDGVEECQCISIDHPDKLYITDDFIVTHNTFTSLVLAEMLKADLVVMIVPKNAVYRVWATALLEEYVKPQEGWIVADGKPYKNQKYIVAHYEALEKAKQVATSKGGRVVVILDESHNINAEESMRTQTFIAMCLGIRERYVLWASGTPIKALGAEAIPLLSTIDPMFTADIAARFKKIFVGDSSRALDILRNRLGMVKFSVESSAVVTNETHSVTEKIKVPNGNMFTLTQIRTEMGQFIDTRLKHYLQNMKAYKKIYDNCMEVFAKTIKTTEEKTALKSYRSYIETISKGFDPKNHADIAKYCNNYEKNVIIPRLPDSMKKEFRNSKSVVKYPQLKVLGEALGGILGKKRVECQLAMIPGTDFKGIIEKSEKKTIIFSSYVPVVDAIAKHCATLGFKPVVVHAQAEGDLAGNVKKFFDDETANPLIATFQSLSTAVPIIAANTTIFTNVPFRDHELVQAKARTNRLGQDTSVYYVFTYLDTGKEPNISTRSQEILEWSKEQVAAILGADYSGEVTPDLLSSMEGITEITSIAMEHFMDLDAEREQVIDLQAIELADELTA